MNQNTLDKQDDSTRERSFLDWQAKATLAVCASLLAAFGLMPELARTLGIERLKALPSVALVALETMPLQIAFLLSVLLPASLPSAKGALERLWLKAVSLRLVLFVLAVEAVLFPALLVISLASSFVSQLLKLGFDPQQIVVKQALATSPSGFALLFFSAAFLAPIAEELAFRRAVFGFLKSFAGTLPALATSSALFAASHCSVVQFPTLFALGLVLQWSCLRWNSLVPAIMIHSLHNSISMLFLLAFRVLGVHVPS